MSHNIYERAEKSTCSVLELWGGAAWLVAQPPAARVNSTTASSYITGLLIIYSCENTPEMYQKILRLSDTV